jgi:hypothetical protein
MQVNRRTIPKAALIGTGIGSLLNTLIWLVATSIWGIIEVIPPSPAMPRNANGYTEIVAFMPAVATIIAGIGAAVVFWGISHLRKHPYIVFQIVAFCALALSFVGVQAAVTGYGQNVLGLMHMMAAMPIVATLTLMTSEGN